MYKNILKAHDQLFELGVVLPKTAAYTCAQGLPLGTGQNALAVTIAAKTPVAIAAAKAFTVTLAESDDNVTFADTVTMSVTYATAQVFTAGSAVCRFPLPALGKKWLKVKVSCTDAAASGSVDVFTEYLAR